MRSGQTPIVSICCPAYNQANYIRDAIEGILKQQITYPVEIIIHDDASSDGTAAIIKEYAQMYSDLIVPILQVTNQYSRGIKIWPSFLFPRAKGKYIALCEGDDYWTDPLKLQKQVEFLEANPEFALTVGGFIQLDVKSNKQKDIIIIPPTRKAYDKGYEFTLDDLKDIWITKTLTLVFRNDKKIVSQLLKYECGRDINLIYHLLKNGRKGFYFTEVMGVYRIHEKGIFSMEKEDIARITQYNVYKDLYLKNRDEFTRSKNFRFTLRLLNYNLFNHKTGNAKKNQLRLFVEALRLIRKPQEFRQLIFVLLGPLQK